MRNTVNEKANDSHFVRLANTNTSAQNKSVFGGIIYNVHQNIIRHHRIVAIIKCGTIFSISSQMD